MLEAGWLTPVAAAAAVKLPSSPTSTNSVRVSRSGRADIPQGYEVRPDRPLPELAGSGDGLRHDCDRTVPGVTSRALAGVRALLPGLIFAGVGTAPAFGVNQLVPAVSALTVAVVLGVVVGQFIPDSARAGLG